MKNKKEELIIKLVDNSIILEKTTRLTKISVDITPVWHFFKEVIESMEKKK